MATLTPIYPTIVDWAKASFRGNMLRVVENLMETNAHLARLPWVQANGETSHTYSRQLSVPTPTWVGFNEGPTASKGSETQLTASIKTMEALSEIEEKMLNIAPDKNAYRASRDALHLTGLDNENASKIFYGDSSSDPMEPNGVMQQCNTLQTTGPYVIDNGGTVTLSSIYGIQWGEPLNYMVFPKNHASAGLEMQDKGNYPRAAPSGTGTIFVNGTLFRLSTAFVNEDPRALIRLANINSVSGGAGEFDDDKLHEALSYWKGAPGELYASRAIWYQISKLAKDKSNVSYSMEQAFGNVLVPHFMGYPVFLAEAISNAETVVA